MFFSESFGPHIRSRCGTRRGTEFSRFLPLATDEGESPPVGGPCVSIKFVRKVNPPYCLGSLQKKLVPKNHLKSLGGDGQLESQFLITGLITTLRFLFASFRERWSKIGEDKAQSCDNPCYRQLLRISR